MWQMQKTPEYKEKFGEEEPIKLSLRLGGASKDE